MSNGDECGSGTSHTIERVPPILKTSFDDQRGCLLQAIAEASPDITISTFIHAICLYTHEAVVNTMCRHSFLTWWSW